MTPKPGPPPHLCPKCSRTMREHCTKIKCRWLFCPVCNIRKDTVTGNHIGQAQT